MIKKTFLLLFAAATLAVSTGSLSAVPPVPVCPPVCDSGTLN